MSGIFGGHIFEGFGQVDKGSDQGGKTGSSDQGSWSGGKTGSSDQGGLRDQRRPAFFPGSPPEPAFMPQQMPGLPASPESPQAQVPEFDARVNNTMLYVAGGVAVVGVIAYLSMGRGRGKVTANRRRRRR